MSNSNEAIAYSLRTSQSLLQRFTDDLTAQEYVHRPMPKANCAAWLIGHLTLSDRNTLKRFNVPLPALPEGFEHRFSRDEGCPQANEFGDAKTLVPLFNEHRQKLIDAILSSAPEQLDKSLEKPHPLFKTLGELANFMAAHTAMHAGQITMIRRSLGRPPLV